MSGKVGGAKSNSGIVGSVSNIKFAPTDTEPTVKACNVYYDDSEDTLKHYTGSAWATFVPPNYLDPGAEYVIDSNTKMLLQMEDTALDCSANSSTTTTASGQAARSSTQAKIGTYSMSLDGTGDYLQCGSGSTEPDEWDWGTGSGTLDFWVYLNNTSGTQLLAGRVCSPAATGACYPWSGTQGEQGWSIRVNNSAQLYWSENAGSAWSNITGTGTISATSWTHIALVKDGNDITLYRDGASVGTSSGSGNFETGGSYSIVNFPITIGAGWDNGNATYYADGYIDQFRVSNTARWTGNFST